MELIFATNNQHKLFEIKNAIGHSYLLKGLSEAGILEDIPEDYETLEENSLQKASYIYEKFKKNCFADDTGLEVEILNGRPGVFSARYSKMGSIQFPDMEANEGNIKKLLLELKDQKNRSARFRTIITLILNGEIYYFEGIVNGTILNSQSGKKGFGYDPIFCPNGMNKSFAEMDLVEKNRISHRAIASKKLVDFLNSQRLK